METYKIQQKIHTLLHICAGTGDDIHKFELSGIKFEQVEFSIIEGWQSNYWIATGEIQDISGLNATNVFREKIESIVCGLCLVGQAFTEYKMYSTLTTKKGSEYGLFFYFNELSEGNNLMFTPENLEALQKILEDKNDYTIFLKYWKDITNTPDMMAKLILYCASVDALTKVIAKENWEKEKHDLRIDVLGKTLKEKLFGTKEDFSSAVRHKLVHGEYFNFDNPLELKELHESIIRYFNNEVLKEQVISTNVVSPQRNPYKNYETSGRVIKLKKPAKCDLLTLEKDYSESNDDRTELKHCEILSTAKQDTVLAKF